MLFEWISQEHHRLHVIEEWPEGPMKQAALAAVHSKLRSLMGQRHSEGAFPHCLVCQSRHAATSVSGLSNVVQIDTYPDQRAA